MNILQGLEFAVTAAFVFLGLATTRDWLLHRDQRRGYLALAFGLLGAVAVVSRVDALTNRDIPLLGRLTLLGFLASAWPLLLLRHSFIPLSRRVRVAAGLALAASAALPLVVGTRGAAAARPSAIQVLAMLGVVVAWSAVVGEAAVRFWIASSGRPAVQRKRLRALSSGYLGIIAILLVDTFAGRESGMGARVVTQLMALVIAPLLYAGFAPPRWLRRAWRESEEQQFREAINDLLLFSASRQELATRGLEWALRLVGGEMGLIQDGNGEFLAVAGISEEQASEMVRALPERASSWPRSEAFTQQEVIDVSLGLDSGSGRLVVAAGPFTPLFGTEETARLVQWSAALTASLDRVRVAERVAALEEVKSRFLRLASHELRGPLSLVNGYISMIAEGSLTGDEITKAVPVMAGRLAQMTGMLNEMLETARMEDDRLDLKIEVFDLRPAVEEVMAAIRPLVGKEHALEVKLPPVEIPVAADRTKVVTIIGNLVDNAVKYSPHGGEVRCSLDTRDGKAILTVSDSGIGIAREDMGTLFTRFGRIASTETTSIPGTGLGLYLARELAHLQSGEILAESHPGQGSRFTFVLPVTAAT